MQALFSAPNSVFAGETFSDAPFVFISYAVEDLKAAKKTAAALSSLAIDYWLDESRIRPEERCRNKPNLPLRTVLAQSSLRRNRA